MAPIKGRKWTVSFWIAFVEEMGKHKGQKRDG